MTPAPLSPSDTDQQSFGRRRRPSVPVTGAARDQLRTTVVGLYTNEKQPLSIRGIAAKVGRSFGFVHRLLVEAKQPRRPAHRHSRTTRRGGRER
ncbi:helix-turn-helix domain-containing protein [Actinoplanes flavus]|uniref:Helix-turn-helix domain-containing protein n=1 Tax=Actinoplanes flavus TaxID=2820290 RepID=A0ABS3UE21_9ACTN|nr:helix-turn-helix domain-containing protein [Actinoplanes flavus]MBO3736691.1 hypothetical protein [Actinoplanes flavus]